MEKINFHTVQFQRQPEPAVSTDKKPFDWQTTLKVILVVVAILISICALIFIGIKLALPIFIVIGTAVAGACCCPCGKDTKEIDRIGRDKIRKEGLIAGLRDHAENFKESLGFSSRKSNNNNPPPRTWSEILPSTASMTFLISASPICAIPP